MKKTVSVNIGGFAFNIEESAYDQLRAYLAAVENNLASDQAEIMRDIEARIAEIFKDKLAGTQEVIDESNIEEIISIMGQPEDYQDEEDQASNESKSDGQSESFSENRKSLFRDMDNASLGGVCSGLARYFDVDPLFIRILFVFFAVFAGSGLLLYIILWLVIPEAKTTADKLKMSGEHINLESIKSHFNQLGRDINQNIKSKKINKKINKFVDSSVTTAQKVAKVMQKIIGTAFIIASIVGLFFFTLYLLGNQDIIPFSSFIIADSLFDFSLLFFPTVLLAKIAFVSLIVIIAIPLLSFLLAGIKMVFNLNGRVPKSIKLILGVFFTLAICFLFIAGIRTGVHFSHQAETEKSYVIPSDITSIQIEVEDPKSTYFLENSMYYGPQFMDVKKDSFGIRNVALHLSAGTDSIGVEVRVMTQSSGISRMDASEHAAQIQYDLIIEDGLIRLPSYMLLSNSQKFRGQAVDVYIKVPENTKVALNENAYKVDCFINHNNYYGRYSKNGKRVIEKKWIAKDGKLMCENCWEDY